MKNTSADTDKKVLLIVGGLTILAIAVIFVFSLTKGSDANTLRDIPSYTASDSERPQVETPLKFSDLGTMKVKDEKQAEFVIENNGNKPLTLFSVSSSCDCTVGIITIDDVSSPEFGMHSKSTWQATLDPGKEAKVAVVYRPYIMPVKGVVTRDVYVRTNDPENKSLTFTVKANVE